MFTKSYHPGKRTAFQGLTHTYWIICKLHPYFVVKTFIILQLTKQRPRTDFHLTQTQTSNNASFTELTHTANKTPRPGPLIGPFESGGVPASVVFSYISNYGMLPKINKLLLQWPQQTQHMSEPSIFGSVHHRVIRTHPAPTGHSKAVLFRHGSQALGPSWEVMESQQWTTTAW